MTIEKIGRRFYITGNTYGAKNELKAAGCHWDADRRAWWTAKENVAERFGGRADEKDGSKGGESRQPKPENPDRVEVIGKASYKGREYYVRWVGRTRKGDYKARLTTLDAKIDFWAACAQPGYRPAADEACVIKTYQDARTLGSIRRFVDEKKREEAVAKEEAAKVKAVARGESTREIRHLTDARMIRAFFGDRAVPYNYRVTQDQFDEEDNQGPGHYYGVTVPASLCDRWDAGILACKERKIEARSREGLTLRYRIMSQDEAAALPKDLEELLAEKESKEAAEKAAKEEREKKAAETKAAIDSLLDGLVQSSVGPTKPATAAPRIDGEAIPHHMATSNPGDCVFGGEGMLVISRGDTRYEEGRTANGQRVVYESIRAYDDWRVYYWAPADVAKAWALAYAANKGITIEAAKEWLGKYDGCHGSDLYRTVVENA